MFKELVSLLGESMIKWGADGSADEGDFVLGDFLADRAEEKVHEEINDLFAKYDWLPPVFLFAGQALANLYSLIDRADRS